MSNELFKQLHNSMKKQNMLKVASAQMKQNNMLSEASKHIKEQIKKLKI